MHSSAAGMLIGDSECMVSLRQTIEKIGPSALPVLIEGETGTGKELVAQALHSVSARRGRFVPFNVLAIPDTMFESTLFGHVRGAFTGATHSSDGFLAEADAGTAFFDEIGTMTLAAQAKLLRALETGAFRPVGANADRRSSFRTVAASNELLAERVAAGLFRGDLAQRLAGYVLRVPTLRDRPADIVPLAAYFLASCASKRLRISPGAARSLRSYDWPGNVRELRMLAERMALLASGNEVSEHDVVHMLRSSLGSARPDSSSFASHSQEREMILSTLRQTAGDTARAATALGLHRSTLYRRMAELGLDASVRRALRFEVSSECR